MRPYSGNNRPYTYVSYPEGKKEQALSVLEKLTASDEGKKLRFWYTDDKALGRKEKKRMAAANSLLIFAGKDSLSDERFKQTADTAISCGKDVLCVHLEELAYDTLWSQMQLSSQQAIGKGSYTGEDSLAEKLKDAEIFKDMRVTKEQRRNKRRQMAGLFALLLAAALCALGGLVSAGVIPEFWVQSMEQAVTNTDAELVIHTYQGGPTGTEAELAEIKKLFIVGNKTIDYKNFPDKYIDIVQPNEEYYELDGVSWTPAKFNRIFWGDFDCTIGATISRGKIEDISFLQYLPNLEELVIAGNMVTDISPVFKLKKLKKLNLSSNYIESVEGIEALQELEQVGLEYNLLNDVSDIFKCPKLHVVTLNGNNGLTDIGTSDLSGIDRLEIAHTGISSLPKVGAGKYWVVVFAHDTPITDYSFISEVSGIGQLKADGAVKETLIPALMGKKVGYLAWEHSDLNSLGELEGLELDEGWGLLEIVRCDITDCHGAEKIKNLNYLSLYTDPKLKSLKGLEKSKTLKCVGINYSLEDSARWLHDKYGIRYFPRIYQDNVGFGCNEGEWYGWERDKV